jgi:hypothetical protein
VLTILLFLQSDDCTLFYHLLFLLIYFDLFFPKNSVNSAEDALVGIELPLVLSQGCESLFKNSDERVIHIGFDVLIELLLETGLDSSLVCSVGVLQPE